MPTPTVEKTAIERTEKKNSVTSWRRSGVSSRILRLARRDQSFLLKDDKGQRIGYFIPVNFTSKSYGKQICRLFYFDLDNNFKYSELFADAGSSDEVVPNCVAIEAISIQTVGVDEVNYLAVLRHLFFSNYGHVGVVVNFKKGNIHYDSELNKCIDAQGESPNINSLKKKILFCQRSHKSNN